MLDFDDLEELEDEKAKDAAEQKRVREAEEKAAKEAAARKAAEERAAREAATPKEVGEEAAKVSSAPTLDGPKRSEAVLLRHEVEKSRKFDEWKRVELEQLQASHQKLSPGLLYGIDFPFSQKALEEMGPTFLTKAFHVAGTLPKDNAVAKIMNIKEFIGGGACFKMMFDVEYAKECDLPTELFAKYPYPLEGKTLSDRMSSSLYLQGMELSEINASRVLEAVLPCEIPAYCYGDISNETTNFIIITARIPFGQQRGDRRYDPGYDKMKDWELLGDPEEYYRLLVRTGARIAGEYKAGKLLPQDIFNKLFVNMGGMSKESCGVAPTDTGINETEFKHKIKMGMDFIQETARVLFPNEVTSPEFMENYKALLTLVNAYTAEIGWWCQSDSDYVAFTHGNLNVDNSYFWRDPEHQLHVGVLDWGGASATCVGYKLWWWLYCCEPDFLLRHVDGLLDCFVDNYARNGGPRLDVKVLRTQFMFAALNQAIGLLGAVPQIYRMCPKKEWPTIKDRKDPRISKNIDGKNTLRIYVGTFINICCLINHCGLQELVEDWVDAFSEREDQPRKIPRGRSLWKARPYVPMDEPDGALWQIVGGADKGGVLVREGESTSSQATAARLSTGSIVKQLALRGERLNYKIISGSGPQVGWVSTKLTNKDLAVPYVEIGPNGPKRNPPPWKVVEQPNIEYMDMKTAAAKDDPGDYYGLQFPYTTDQLVELGPAWLTQAFHKSGVLPLDNAVIEINNAKEFVGGGAGLKCTFSVKYHKDEPYLHKNLFAKLPHKPGGSDRYFVSMMWNHDRPEIIFNIFMSDYVPFRVPKFYFGDIAAASTNYILITENLEWGEKGKTDFKPYELEPAYDKYKDWELPDGGPAYYIACCKALGKMAGYHKAKKLHPSVSAMFPMPDAIPHIPKGLPAQDAAKRKESLAKVDQLVKFLTETAKKAFPAEVTDEAFLSEWKEDAMDLLDYQVEIHCFMNGAGTSDPHDYVALTHNNLQVDNAFFWRDETGTVQVGLLDWGVLGCGPVANALQGCISGAQEHVYQDHLDTFLTSFIDAYADNGGPRLDLERLRTMMLLHAATWSVNVTQNVTQVLKFTKVKEWAEIDDWFDPRIMDRFQCRTHCAQFKMSLLLWRRLGIKDFLRQWKVSQGLPPKKL
mmetsp:Transcript_35483/g.81203  ORF Transcript_35483/g.81203 Transcript_35483/m.81203 type:complete len:1148 (-) Transcript_35483:189-3632(-)